VQKVPTKSSSPLPAQPFVATRTPVAAVLVDTLHANRASDRTLGKRRGLRGPEERRTTALNRATSSSYTNGLPFRALFAARNACSGRSRFMDAARAKDDTRRNACDTDKATRVPRIPRFDLNT
jgi:hypothetical protein